MKEKTRAGFAGNARSGGRRRMLRALTSAALVGGMLTMGVGGAAVALADTTPSVTASADAGTDRYGSDGDGDDMQIQSSQGFKIYNLTGYRMELDSVEGDKSFEGRPKDNSIITPAGQPDDWEIVQKYGYLRTTTANYVLYDGQDRRVGTVSVRMEVDFKNLVDPKTKATCTLSSGLTCSKESSDKTIKVMETAGTVHDVPADQAQQQAEVLNTLCAANSSDITCRFTPTKREQVPVGLHKVGKTYTNLTDQPITKEVTTTETVGVTQSMEVSSEAKGNLFSIVELSVNLKYGQTWARSTQVTDKTTYTIPPGQSFWTETAYDVTRDTGNFTVKIGNSTWNLTGVYFDSPNVNSDDKGEVRWEHGAAQSGGVKITNDDQPIQFMGTWGTVT